MGKQAEPFSRVLRRPGPSEYRETDLLIEIVNFFNTKEMFMSNEQDNKLEIEEISTDELEEVSGGATCDTCNTCAGCSHTGCMGCGVII
jgi:hypothetical protein